MPRQVINLTLPVIKNEIEKTLEYYPYYPHQYAFANPSFRQKLIAYVAGRIQNIYMVVDQAKNAPLRLDSILNILNRKLMIRTTIQEGIQSILEEYPKHHSPELQPQSSLGHYGMKPSRVRVRR